MIRKILALSLAVLPSLVDARDLTRGTFEVGAKTSFDTGSGTSEISGLKADVSSTTLSADVLAYVVSHFGIGLGVSYDRTKTEATTTFGDVTLERTQWVIGPEAKLSLPLSPRVSALLVGEVGRMTVDQNDVSADGWAYLAGAGLRFFPADFVSLDALFDYTYSRVSSSGDDLTSKGWDVAVGFSIFFGGK